MRNENDLRIDDLPGESIILPLLEIEAQQKNLKVFVFKDEELKKYHTPISDEVGVALLAKNEDNAKNNIANLRRCYTIRIGK